MKKLASLKESLLQSPLGLQEDKLLISAKQGKLISFPSEANKNFEIQYTASITIKDYNGEAEGDVVAIAFSVLTWFKENQSNHKADAVTFETLETNAGNFNTKDLILKLPITETIKVTETTQGVFSFTRYAEFSEIYDAKLQEINWDKIDSSTETNPQDPVQTQTAEVKWRSYSESHDPQIGTTYTQDNT